MPQSPSPLGARLRTGEPLGDRVLKVDHAGEHGAVCIYYAQRVVARWRAPDLVGELTKFLLHERRHRGLFADELEKRGVRRCRSYWLCALGGGVLGFVTGLLGRDAIAATTVAIERVVLRHLEEQLAALSSEDFEVVVILKDIIADERNHHDHSAARLRSSGIWQKILIPIVSASTELVIWIGMAT